METSTPLATAASASFSRLPTCPARSWSGTSFKHEHLKEIVEDSSSIDFFEIHAENYMGSGGLPHQVLSALRREHPISLHGVCMSIGGRQPLDQDHLARFRNLINRYQPVLVSEHLAWSTHEATYFNDLLPLPYTKETLVRVCDHVDEVQTAIGRSILIENPATYVRFEASTFSEVDFLSDLSHRTGCGLLLDINNVFVSATNHGFSAIDYLADFPIEDVGQIHLAGHSRQHDADGGTVLIDSHDEAISAMVWSLFEHVIARRTPVPTLIEWDSKLPPWSALKAEAEMAKHVMARACDLVVETSDVN